MEWAKQIFNGLPAIELHSGDRVVGRIPPTTINNKIGASHEISEGGMIRKSR